MSDQFDLFEGGRRKEEGIDLAAASRKERVEAARLIAIRVARQQGDVTSDDVYRAMLRDGLDPELGPAAGAVFRRDFIFTGQWRKSQRVTNHASDLRVWRLKETA